MGTEHKNPDAQIPHQAFTKTGTLIIPSCQQRNDGNEQSGANY